MKRRKDLGKKGPGKRRKELGKRKKDMRKEEKRREREENDIRICRGEKASAGLFVSLSRCLPVFSSVTVYLSFSSSICFIFPPTIPLSLFLSLSISRSHTHTHSISLSLSLLLSFSLSLSHSFSLFLCILDIVSGMGHKAQTLK